MLLPVAFRHGLDCLLERATPKPLFTGRHNPGIPLPLEKSSAILCSFGFQYSQTFSLKCFLLSILPLDWKLGFPKFSRFYVHPVNPYWPFLANSSFSAASSLLPWRVLVPLRSFWTEPKASSHMLNLTNHVPEMKCWLCIAHGFRWCPLSPEGPLFTQQDLHSQRGSKKLALVQF